MENLSLDSILETFLINTENPASFLGTNQSFSHKLKEDIKNIYDFTKNQEKCYKSKKKGKSLNKLIINNFDLEQIWQQIELQNDDVRDTTVKELSGFLVKKNELIFKSLNLEDSNSEKDSDLDEKEENNDELSMDSEDLSSDNEKEVINDEKQKESVVDDDFFKLSEMEAFLNKEENPKKTLKDSASESESEEGSIDLFQEESEASSEDEAKKARFKDYFVAKDDILPKKKTNKLMKELDEEDEDSNNEEVELINNLKSTLELRQERLQKKIQDLEEEAITEKPWQLKGEITAESRPQNSLLEEIVEFDLTTRPAPVITEQTSLQLEDIIRQRIKHKTFDSVEKISRPIETPLEYKKRLVLDQEKSKESLANIYEKEYLQQAAMENTNLDVEEKEPETHKEIKKLMKNLFGKLDALSNFHFTATPAIPELKIVSNLPAVNMEEVAPVAASEAALLAPEEIRNKTKGDIVGKSEKSKTDKKRERRKKKLKQKIHSKIQEKKGSNKKERVKA